MSIYSINYQKVTDGYNKIMRIIESTEIPEHTDCIPRLVDSWVNLVDHYCDQVYVDRSNRNRKSDANRLGDTAAKMFESIKETYENKMQQFAPEEYEGNFKPCRVKSLPEMVHEQNGYDDYDQLDENNE